MRRFLPLAVVLLVPVSAQAGGWSLFSGYGTSSKSSSTTTSWWTYEVLEVEEEEDDPYSVSLEDTCGTCDQVLLDLDGYELLLEDLNTGVLLDDMMGDDGLDLDVIPQLWEGTSTVGLMDGSHGGNVHTDKDGNHWTETWVLFDGADFDTEVSLAFDGPGLLPDYQPVYDSDPAVASFVVLEFDYEYRSPPTATAIASLPDTVPDFVDATTSYEVLTVDVITGGSTVTGGLHRQHYVDQSGTEWWRDTWVLWDDYVRPVGPNVATELVVLDTGLTTVKAFLEDQAGHEQHAYVQTTATPTAL